MPSISTHDMRGFKPEITITLTLGNGTTKTITDHELMQGSLAVKSGTSISNQFTVGGAVIGSVSFSIIDKTLEFHGLDWYDSRVSLQFVYPNGQTVTKGPYYVVSHKESGLRVYVESYDAMKVLDEYSIYEESFDWDTETIKTALDKICASRSLSYRGVPNTSSKGQLRLMDPNNDMMTERAFVSYVAQMMGMFVIAEGSTLVFSWYSDGIVYDEGVTFAHDLQTANYTIGGVKVTANDNETIATQGSGKKIEISDNPFITPDNVNTIASNIYSAVNGLTFRPGNVSIVNDGFLRAGDFIQVQTGQESGIKMIATNITFYPTKLKMSVTADADAQASDLRITRSQYFRRATQQAISDELDDPDSDLSQAIEQASGGGGQTITLPGVRVICAKSNDDEVLGHYDGFTAEMDQFQQTGAVWTNRKVAGRSTTSITTLAGIEIMNVTYPEQKISVPENDGESCYVNLLITRIQAPTLIKYRAIYGSSVTTSQWKGRVCNFDITPARPYIVTVRVTRHKGTSGGRDYDNLTFEANTGYDPNVGALNRPMAVYSGFSRMPMAASSSGSEPYTYRIPVCDIPLPGNAFSLLTNKWTAMDNYCDYVNLYPI